MTSRSLRFVGVLSWGLLAATAALAGSPAAEEKLAKPPQETEHVRYLPPFHTERHPDVGSLVAKTTKLVNHGGPVLLPSTKVVFIFWGPTFSNTLSPDHVYATTLEAYRNQLATTAEFNVLQEYCAGTCLSLTNLGSGTADGFDTSTPPVNVTDALVQGKVNTYLTTHTFDTNTVYEVVIPSTSYSSNGGVTSCGGSSLGYCSYHSWMGSGATAKKYSIQPYPSCSGCQTSGFSAVQNQEVFVEHETADTATDPTATTWYDSAGNEVADKCSSPYLSGGYGYQRLWSNKSNACL